MCMCHNCKTFCWLIPRLYLRFSKRCILFTIFLLLFVMILLVPYLDPQTTSRQQQQLLVIDPVFYSHQKKAVSPDSLSQKISPNHPSSHSNLWIDLDPENMTIIRRTVFFDSREHFGPQIVMISMHHDAITKEKPNLYARIPQTSRDSYNRDRGFHCLKVLKWKQVGSVRKNVLPPETYVTYLLRIKDSVALSEVPPYIELTTDKECKKDMQPKMPVFYDQRPRDGVFAVCTQKGLYGHVTPEEVINWVEINRAMGAAIITIQIQHDQLGDDIKQVLLPYIKEGFVELIDWKVAIDVRDYGMSACANECIYRNVNRAQFVAVHDFDELLVPQQHTNWSEMITYLHKIIKINNYASLSFRNTHWYYNSEKGSLTGRLCKGVEAPVYFNWTLRTRNPTLVSPKIMANLDNAIAAFCHTVWWYRRGTRKEYRISPSIGLSHHYRIPYKGMDNLQSSVMDKYVSTVIPRLKKTYSALNLC